MLALNTYNISTLYVVRMYFASLPLPFVQELLHSSSSLGHSRTWDDMSEEMDKWKTTVELLLQGMDKRLSQLEDKLKELDKSYKQS